MNAIKAAKLKIGVDPLGGAAVHYWQPIADRYDLDITVTNAAIDPTFRFMTLDHDGEIRMDFPVPLRWPAWSSSKTGRRRLRERPRFRPTRNRHQVDRADEPEPLSGRRHTLSSHPPRPVAGHAKVGKTLVSSSLIDRVVNGLNRPLAEVPVGFKWFSPAAGRLVLLRRRREAGEFLRRDGTVWTTDKDGPILDLLAAEMLACTGKDPGEHYLELTKEFGTPFYTRIDAPGDPEQKTRLLKLDPSDVKAADLAGEPIVAKLTRAGQPAPIGGLKVVAANGWFAARPSGTENIYKIYAESFRDQAHLDAVVAEAQRIVGDALST